MTPVPSDLEGAKPGMRHGARNGLLPQIVEADVIVVGAGASGLAAAVAASANGAEVALLEAAGAAGGTAMKSAGGFLVTDNKLQNELGFPEDRETTLRFFAKVSHPDQYDPDQPRLGLSELDYELITTFYDRSGE